MTQINLTLIPSGTGTGGIHIIVNWGTHLSQWFQQNRGTTLSLGMFSLLTKILDG